MEPFTFVIAILGCGEGESPCEEIALAGAGYPSMAACMAATQAELVRHGDRLYPVVVAQCRRSGAAAQRVSGVDVARPQPPRLRRN